MVSVEIYCRRLAASHSTYGLLNRELYCRDVIIQAASERIHVKGAPVTVLGCDATGVARHRIAIHNHLSRRLGNYRRTASAGRWAWRWRSAAAVRTLDRDGDARIGDGNATGAVAIGPLVQQHFAEGNR